MKKLHPYFCHTVIISIMLLFAIGNSTFAQNQLSPSPNKVNSQEIEERRTARELEQKRSQLYSAARRLESRQAYEDAYLIFLDLFTQVPEKNEYYDGMRRSLLALNRYEEAIQLIEARKNTRSRFFSPVNAEAQLGEVYYLMGDKEKAFQHWSIAIDIAPQSSNTYQIVASIMLRHRLLDEAIAIFQRGRDYIKNDELFSINLATLHQARMDWLNATREYLKTLRSADNRQSFVRRGLANFPDTQEADQAIELIVNQELNESKDKNYWAGYRMVLRELLVDNFVKRGQFLKALEQVEQYDLDERALGEKLLNFAGDCLEESQDSVATLALEKASTYLTDNEGIAIINLTLADIENKYGRYANADSLLNSLLAQHPQGIIRFLTLYKRGINSLYGLNMPEKAIPDFRNIIRENSQENENLVLYHLAVAYAKSCKYEEALKALDDLMKSRSTIRNQVLPEMGEYQKANPVLLAARISLWQNNPSYSESLLDSLVVSPSGWDAENEALELLYLVASVDDTLAMEKFSRADQLEYMGEEEKALVLFDSLAQIANDDSTFALECLWRKTLIETRLGNESALDSFIVNHYDHPRSETAVFIKLGRLINQNKNDEAIQILEDYLVYSETGVLASLARRRLDELKAFDVVNDLDDR